MLEGAFSFRGRIGRLRYVLDSLVLVALCVGVVILITILSIPARSPAMAMLFGGLCTLLMLPVVFWISLSLQARRFRDIGLNPLYVMPAWFLAMAADAIVVHAVPHLAALPHVNNTVAGLLINFGLSLALFFWPGNGKDGEDLHRARLQVFDAEQEPIQAQAPGILGTRTMSSQRAPRTSFGRRGLKA